VLRKLPSKSTLDGVKSKLARVFLVLLLMLSPAAQAVVISTASGDGNTNAPVDDPGWANIGIRGGGTGIYLGNTWVLTASHVGAGSITLGGISYGALAGSTVQLTNSTPGKSLLTDLIMFRLETEPAGIGALTLMSSPPTLDAPLVMIGAGRDRGAFTQWTVNQSTTPWTWTEVPSGGNAAGYQTLTTRAMRWGTNTVFTNEVWVGVDVGGVRNVHSFVTAFDFSAGADEAQAVEGDSGGAVFFKNGSAWELGGVMFAVDGFSGQPDEKFTPVYGDVTFSADLSYYSSQIMNIIPEPSTYALLVVSTLGLGVYVLRRRLR